MIKITGFILASALVVGSPAPSHADLSADLNTQTTQMNTLATSQGDGKVVDKISSQFGDFLGADSKAIVTGLRNGTPIKLTRTTSTSGTITGAPPTNTTTTSTTTTTIINPPTGKMGFGNVFISLALAKQQLGQLGITQPTPEQLKVALVGGSLSTGTGTTTSDPKLQGILTMRSQHMGWGQIAQKLGSKLGPVVSGLKSTNQSMTTATASSQNSGIVAGSGQPNKGSESGIVSGSGKIHGVSGNEISGKSGYGQGIVSASGKSAGGGNGSGYGKTIVTGSGHVAGGNSGGVTGSGPGSSSGQGNGHNK
jgi:hypothetical protein